jgi:hypothetical protein
MAEDHLKAWRSFSSPPKQYLRSIGGGKLRGKTDINPQWRILALTECYGPCGIGWGWYETNRSTLSTPEGEVMCFVTIKLWTSDMPSVHNHIQGDGGNYLIVKDKNGLSPNDDGWKMAITDAIGTASKYLGVGADVYAGQWDGSKYTGHMVMGQEEERTSEALAKAIAEASTKDEISAIVGQIRVAKDKGLLSEKSLEKLRSLVSSKEKEFKA